MKLISPEEAINLISINKVNNFNELLLDNISELELLYPNEKYIENKFKDFIDGKAETNEVSVSEMYHSFIRISRPYRNRPTITRIQYPISIAQENNCKTILDFGGGGGTECIAFAKSGLKTTYADKLSLKNTDTVAKRFKLRNLDINMIDGELLLDKRYDIVTAFDVLEHLYDVEKYIASLASRVRMGGFLIIYPDFDCITYDGDHLEKNVVYRDIFDKMINHIGFEKIAEDSSILVYTRNVCKEENAVRKELYSFVKSHCETVINECTKKLKNDTFVSESFITKYGITDIIRKVGGKIPIPHKFKKSAFTVYKKSCDENVLDKLSDHYAVFRIASYRLKNM